MSDQFAAQLRSWATNTGNTLLASDLNKAANIIEAVGEMQISDAELVARPLRQQLAALTLERDQLRTLFQKQQTRLDALRLIIDLDAE